MRPYRLITIIFLVVLVAADLIYFGGYADWWWILLILAVYVHTLVLGAIYIQWNFFMPSYSRGENKKLIALTFDDGPAKETEAILNVLKQQNVTAAFFTIGKNAVQNPAIVKRWDAEGHLIGNHSYHHGFNFDWQSSGTMAAEIEKTNAVVEQITGKSPRLFRPPYGVTNPNLARAVKKACMYSIGWNLRSFDTKAKDPATLLKRILSKLKGGDIILLHDSMPVTAQILTDLITEARKKGYTFARVDKMLGIDAYA